MSLLERRLQTLRTLFLLHLLIGGTVGADLEMPELTAKLARGGADTSKARARELHLEGVGNIILELGLISLPVWQAQ